MNIKFTTDAGYFYLQNVIKIQETDGSLIMTVKKVTDPSKKKLKDIKMILDYMKIEFSTRMYGASMDVSIKINPGIKIEIINGEIKIE